MKQYLKLLMAREGKEVLGRNGSNLWILILVLVATFASIAFSEGSKMYLEDRMADPFTNWVNISNKAKTTNIKFNSFRDSLELISNMQKYDYDKVLTDQYDYYLVERKHGKTDYLTIRFFEDIQTKLVKEILKEKNIVRECNIDTSLLDNHYMGFIITSDIAYNRLGYTRDSLPSYLDLHRGLKAEDEDTTFIDSLGISLVDDKFYRLSLPVLAVVHRLPNNVDMMSTNFLYQQCFNTNNKAAFDLVCHEAQYLHELIYWVADEIGVEKFDKFTQTQIPDSLQACVVVENDEFRTLKSWKPGNMCRVKLSKEELPIQVYTAIAKAIEQNFDKEQVRRVYRYDTEEKAAYVGDYLSIQFNSLNHIGEFEAFAKNCEIDLEMESVHSMQNFNAVSNMAQILTIAMVIFSIVCIIMFLVNMLQGYFQKVKRNLGTFKAFGMNTRELTLVYIFILITIVMVAVIMALMITWGIQGSLHVLGIEKEGFNYLSLWNPTTYVATTVILASTIVTVIIVMKRLLSQTPGDLIYDRN